MSIISVQIYKFTVNVDRPMFLVRVGEGVKYLIMHILDILRYMYRCSALELKCFPEWSKAFPQSYYNYTRPYFSSLSISVFTSYENFQILISLFLLNTMTSKYLNYVINYVPGTLDHHRNLVNALTLKVYVLSEKVGRSRFWSTLTCT